MHSVRAVFAEEDATVQHLLRGLVPITTTAAAAPTTTTPTTSTTTSTTTSAAPKGPGAVGRVLLRRLDNAALLETAAAAGCCRCYQLSDAVVEEATRAALASELSSRMTMMTATHPIASSTAPPSSSSSFPAVYVLLPYRLGCFLYQHYDVKASLLEPDVYKR